MSCLKRTLSLLVVVAAGAVLAVPASAALQRRQDDGFISVAVGGTLHFEVYLPNGYDQTTERYPVVYVLHGLPSSSSAYRTLGFVERALDAAGSPAILVAPQGSRTGETDPEYLDRGPRDRWETAIATELVRRVDAGFRTIPSRSGRALIGISAGGYGAMHLGLGHLDAFSVVESWSGYFHPTDPTGTAALDLGSDRANAAANVHVQLAAASRLLRSHHTFIAFYVGAADQRFDADNALLNQELTRHGVAHVFRIYPGGHDQSLWQRYATAWLRLALAHLAPAG